MGAVPVVLNSTSVAPEMPRDAVPGPFLKAVNRLKANTVYYKFHAALDELLGELTSNP